MSARGVRVALLLVASWAVQPTAPVRAESAEQLLQEGQHQEEILGDLPRAIESYEKVLELYARSRGSAARAHYGIGRCLAKMGALDEARAAYRAIIESFADQADVVAQARTAIRAIGVGDGQSPVDLGLRLFLEYDMLPMNPHRPAEFDFAPDGEHIVYRDRSTLLISGGGAAIRPIADIGPEFWPMPRWSPDGRRIAYVAADTRGSQRRLWVVEAAGGEPRSLAGAMVSDARGLCWTPDSRAITCLVPGTGLVTVGLEAGTSHTTPLTTPPAMRLGPYSPDGRWLVASVPGRSGTPLTRDLWLVPAGGGELTRLTDTPGLDTHPTWSADGDALYFVSDRGGAWNIWQLDLSAGRPDGPPRKVTDFSDAQALFPRAVAGGKQLGFGLVRTRRSVQVADALDPSQARHLTRGRAPLVAPDGATVYYLGEGPRGEGVFSVSSQGGPPEQVAARGPVRRPGPREYDLSGDGRWLAYGGVADGAAGLLVHPTRGGEARMLWAMDGGDSIVPRFSPDGGRLAFVWGRGIYTVPTDGGEAREVAQLSHWNQRELAWSPSGEHLAAIGRDDGDEGDALFLIDASGGTPRRLTPGAPRVEGLAWHPDGARITYLCHTQSEGRDTELREVRLDGTRSRRLVDEPFQRESAGAWSPDGRWLYFGAVRGPSRVGLWRRDDRSGALALVDHNASLPHWSRDGRTIAWTAVHRRRQLWTMDLTSYPASAPGETK